MNPVAKALLLLEASCLTLALLALLLRGHWRTFPLLVLFCAGTVARLAWVIVDGGSHYTAIWRRTSGAQSLLLLAAVAEAAWLLRSEVYGPSDSRRFAALVAVPMALGWLLQVWSFPVTALQLVQLMFTAWASGLMFVALNDLRYAMDVDRRVFWNARIVAGFLVLTVVAGLTAAAKINEWVTLGAFIMPPCCAGVGWMWIFRRKEWM